MNTNTHFRSVMPNPLSENWSVISRAIGNGGYQAKHKGPSSQSGLADTIQSHFFSLVNPTRSGWFWELLKVGKPPIAPPAGGRYNAEGPNGAPEWGLRFQVSFLFPR
ncbi:MAG TPA: hypothetical protein P5205_02000 [Candidatus Paceibacterota bacterium]|nr:hypothetical protein [Verrucomicrobiota bacterium]HSA09119.1 hypothetical protein [Candidatus Paceibacterota bacterium]